MRKVFSRFAENVVVCIPHDQPLAEEPILESHRHVVLLVPHGSLGDAGAKLVRSRTLHHG